MDYTISKRSLITMARMYSIWMSPSFRGYEPAIRVVEEALGAEKLIAPHGAQELQIHIAASRDNGLMLEYYPPAVDPLRGENVPPTDDFRC